MILGNGFDLAHGLPTKYSDFLEFCRRVEKIWSYEIVKGNKEDGDSIIDFKDFDKFESDNEQPTEETSPLTNHEIENDKEQIIREFKELWIDGWKTDETIKEDILAKFKKRHIWIISGRKYKVTSDSRKLSEIHSLLDDNVWYHYFINLYQQECVKGENWIDFESEIRCIIHEMDRHSLSLTYFMIDVIQLLNHSLEDNSFWSKKDLTKSDLNKHKFAIFKETMSFEKYIYRKGLPVGCPITVRDFREKAFEDLERFTRALEIYLAAFVEKIPITKKIPEIATLNPNYVINFNYTNTYQRVYGHVRVHHIHGKANAKRPMKANNMVLGIDEYWVGNERDERTNFTIFKKFAQRIQKHTGNESYKYLKEIQDVFEAKGKEWPDNVDKSEVHPDGVSYVYVFGHSLDVTDKDILSSFIGSDATSVTVYCKDKGTEGELIANTIKLIGEEKLLEKANHVPVKLKYVIQQGS